MPEYIMNWVISVRGFLISVQEIEIVERKVKKNQYRNIDSKSDRDVHLYVQRMEAHLRDFCVTS